MPVVLILLKICILLAYFSIVKMIRDFRKEEKEAWFQMDLLSRIEMSAVAGINLAGLVSVIDARTYAFTFVLCCTGIVLAVFERQRILLAGNRKVLIGGKQYSYQEIRKLGTGLFSLHVYLKKQTKPVRIYVPLTSNEVLRNKVQCRI